MGFPSQEYWSGLPFPSPRDLPDPETEPMSLASPTWAGGFFTTSATWAAQIKCYIVVIYQHHPLSSLLSQQWIHCTALERLPGMALFHFYQFGLVWSFWEPVGVIQGSSCYLVNRKVFLVTEDCTLYIVFYKELVVTVRTLLLTSECFPLQNLERKYKSRIKKKMYREVLLVSLWVDSPVMKVSRRDWPAGRTWSWSFAVFPLVAHSCGLGAAADDYRQNHQWSGDPDPDERCEGHHPGADEWVQSLLQPLRQGTSLLLIWKAMLGTSKDIFEIALMLLFLSHHVFKIYWETGWLRPEEKSHWNEVC